MFLHLEGLNPRHWDYPFCLWNTCYSECFGTPDIIWFYTIPWKLTLNLSEVSSRTFLEKDVCFHWGKPQDESFNTLKRRVCNTTCPAFLWPEKNPLTLTEDSSWKDLGAAFDQDGYPMVYGSRALTKSQQNYAQIEKELPAISYGCITFYQYVFGRHVTLESHYKPLQAIFSKSLYQTPAHLQSSLLTLHRYDFKVIYKPVNIHVCSGYL